MVKRIGVLSNPRSGTSLMVRLLILGFDVAGMSPEFSGEDVYHYRIPPSSLELVGDKSYYVIHIVRDPRAVITSKHPSSPDDFLIDFKDWEENHSRCGALYNKVNVCEVKFEDVLRVPEKVQQTVSNFLQLQIVSKFRDCASIGSSSLYRWSEMDLEMGGARALDINSVHRWSQPECIPRLREQLLKYPQMIDTLISLGYEENADWAIRYAI